MGRNKLRVAHATNLDDPHMKLHLQNYVRPSKSRLKIAPTIYNGAINPSLYVQNAFSITPTLQYSSGLIQGPVRGQTKVGPSRFVFFTQSQLVLFCILTTYHSHLL